MTERIDAHFTEVYVDAATVVNEPTHVMSDLSLAILSWTLVLSSEAIPLQKATQSNIVSSVQIHVDNPRIYAESRSIVSAFDFMNKNLTHYITLELFKQLTYYCYVKSCKIRPKISDGWRDLNSPATQSFLPTFFFHVAFVVPS